MSNMSAAVSWLPRSKHTLVKSASWKAVDTPMWVGVSGVAST